MAAPAARGPQSDIVPGLRASTAERIADDYYRRQRAFTRAYRAVQGVGFQPVASACFLKCVLVMKG